MSNNCSCGLSIGSIIAAILSWQTWHSVGWAVIHACFGGLYVIYWALNYWK